MLVHPLLAQATSLFDPTVIGSVVAAAAAPTGALIFVIKWATGTISEMRKEQNETLRTTLPLVQEMTSLQRETIEALERVTRRR